MSNGVWQRFSNTDPGLPLRSLTGFYHLLLLMNDQHEPHSYQERNLFSFKMGKSSSEASPDLDLKTAIDSTSAGV